MKNSTYTHNRTAQAAILFVALALASAGAWAAPNEPYVNYIVKNGDTLQGLSRTLLNDPSRWAEVAKVNGLKKVNLLSLGQVISVPRSLLNLSSQPRVATPGKVLSVQGDVKMGGQAVLVGAAVPEGAKFETADNSTVIVQLGDGSNVKLMPKTLAEVTSQYGYAMRDPSSSASTTWFSGAIRLVAGAIDTLANKQASRLTPLTVTTPTSVIGVRGTQFRVVFDNPATGISRTEVLEGKVQAENPLQKANASLNGGFGAAINPAEREIKVVALLPALAETALPSQVVRSLETPKADWTVGNLAGAAGYRAQFSLDDKFTQIRGDFKSDSPSLDVSSLVNGNYYARVRGFDASGIEGFDAIKLVEIKTAIKALVWPREIAVGAMASYVPNGILLKVINQSTDKPQQLSVQTARDVAFTQGLQTVALNADSTVVLTDATPGQRVYVRFIDVTSAQPGAISGVFAMDIPGNWGSTVLGMIQPLQPVR